MGAGLGLLRLSPAAFWAMTPREFGAALKMLPRDVRAAISAAPSAPPGKQELAALMARYPDKEHPDRAHPDRKDNGHG